MAGESRMAVGDPGWPVAFWTLSAKDRNRVRRTHYQEHTSCVLVVGS